MLRCGLLGRKLGHSYSPQIHHELASYEYKLYEKEPEELESFLKSGTFDGPVSYTHLTLTTISRV